MVDIIRQKGRWPSIGQPLVAAWDDEAWRREGFASSTAWLDRLAALGGRSTTYLSRCVSAARFLTKLSADHRSLDVSQVWHRPLADIEAFRRQVGDDHEKLLKLLPALASGEFTSHSARQENKEQAVPPGRAERLSFPDIVLKALPDLLSDMGCPLGTTILVEPRTPILRPDAVLIDPGGRISILEVKGSLSGRNLTGLFQQLLALSSLSDRVWLILPSDSELPGQTIIDRLKSVAVIHVGLMLLDPSTCEVAEIFPPKADAPSSESRTAFRELVQVNERGET
jgi:hypothetical protein